MLKSKLGLFSVTAVIVCSFALLAVKNSAKAVRPAEASAATADAVGGVGRTPATQPATNPASGGAERVNLAGEQESAVMAWLQAERPGYHKLMLELKETDPDRYSDRLPTLMKIMLHQQLMSPQERDATNDEREKQVMVAQIAGRMRQVSDDSARAELKKQLNHAISIQFDAEQALREIRLNELEARIKEIRQELDRTRKEREEIIAGRLRRWLKAARPIATKASAAK